MKSAFRTLYGIESAEITELVDQVASHSVEIISFFDIDPGDMQPLSEILYEAKEELGKVNLSYEQLVRELEFAKAELKKANQKLSEMAFPRRVDGALQSPLLPGTTGKGSQPGYALPARSFADHVRFGSFQKSQRYAWTSGR